MNSAVLFNDAIYNIASGFVLYGNKPIRFNNLALANRISKGRQSNPQHISNEVINANGELIGLAFDGNWEAMSGDIAFEPALQRTICADVRYVLFVIEKLGGCKRLIDEMTIVQ